MHAAILLNGALHSSATKPNHDFATKRSSSSVARKQQDSVQRGGQFRQGRRTREDDSYNPELTSEKGG